MKKRQLGISLLEVLLSLSIIAIVMVMATRYFFMASSGAKINQARAQVGAVMAAATDWEAQHNDLSGMSITSLIDSRFLARTQDVAGTQGAETLYSPWKTPIEITSAGTVITMQVASAELCNRLAGSFTGASCASNTLNVPMSDENA